MRKKFNVLVGYLLEEDDNMKRVIELTQKLNKYCIGVKTFDVLCASAFLYVTALNHLSQNPAFKKGDEKIFIDAFTDLVDIKIKYHKQYE